jgi:predicted transcriptional regulator
MSWNCEGASNTFRYYGTMPSQSPIKVSGDTKERIRYLAASSGVTQAEIFDQAVREFAARHADLVERGIDPARAVLAGGEVDIAAHLLDVAAEDVQRVAGPGRRTSSAARP